MYNLNCIKKTLDNGMNVILIQKKGFVKSLFMCATGAGGMDLVQELDGKRVYHTSGCANYLEHQMFRYKNQDVTELFASLQAQTNAFTTFTETCYYFQTTSDIYKPLQLLLEFVETLDINEQSVNKEKGIILSEYDMYQQSPEQRLTKETYKSMYHKHPIRVDILGHRSDIENMSVEDLTQFYNINYDPSSLTLVGITGKDIHQCMSFIENHQKNFPSKLKSHPKTVFEKEQETVVREEYIDYMDISFPYVCVGYKLKGSQSVEDANIKDLAIQMRLDSLFSTMNPDYQKWMDERIISQFAGAECDMCLDRGYILFYAQTQKVNEFIELVNQLIYKLVHEKMKEEDFIALQSSYTGANLRGLDHFESLAVDVIKSSMLHYDYWEWFNEVLNITQEKIMDVCSELDVSHKTITKIYPKEYKTVNHE